MTILIIDCGSSKTPEIGKMISKTGNNSITRSMECSELISDISFYSGVIISGAPILLTEVDHSHHLQFFKFIPELKIPLLGICFGHQILGLTFGAEIYKCQESRTSQNIDILQSDGLLSGFESKVKFSEDHCEAITLPEGFVATGTSEICEVEAMKHELKPFFGVQFHPEVSTDNGLSLFQNFVQLCKTHKTQIGS